MILHNFEACVFESSFLDVPERLRLMVNQDGKQRCRQLGIRQA